MSGFRPFINARRTFLKNSLGALALYALSPIKLSSSNNKINPKMIQIIKKSEQFNDVIFDGRFHANKPVFYGKKTVKPFSSLYYWSHGYVSEPCEFGLHPHEGFEIMTFLWEGRIEHYDTATKVWTPLEAGDFQIIQSNSGIQHQEKVHKNSRAFQIWFDPNFYKAIELKPSYVDYSSQDFSPKNEAGILTTTYIGEESKALALTPNLTIKKMTFADNKQMKITLKPEMSYVFYVLKGNGTIENQSIEIDDSVRISNTKELDIHFQGDLFYIELPTLMEYKAVWG